MHITCPRCGFEGEAAFDFKTSDFKSSSLVALLRERIGVSGKTIPTTATDEEIGEYTVCPRCIGVYVVAGAGSRHRQHLSLLTAERLRRFSPEAQKRLRARMETLFKDHQDSSLREDAIEYLQKFIVERLKSEERKRMRLLELTVSFAALSENHPFYEALTRLINRGRIHTFEEEGAEEKGETTVMVMLV